MKAMVTDENLPKETRPRKVSPVTVTALGGGNLELMFTFLYVSPHPLPQSCGPTEYQMKFTLLYWSRVNILFL